VRVRILVCALTAALVPGVAAAQQGSLQVTGATQTLEGDPRRTFGQPAFEPDLGVTWLQPGTRFGVFQLELRGTRRDGTPHLGRAFAAVRDLKYKGANISLEGGDTYFSSAIGEYRFSNLSTPSLTFAGGSVMRRSSRSSAGVLAGRATATRNYFGTDSDTLDQNLAIARASYKATDRLELFTRASHVRTGDVPTFNSQIARSDQGGGAARWIVNPAVQLIGDASLVSYRRRGDNESHVDLSALAGASFLLARGWFQLNAARFSPGELPIVNQMLTDRQTVYAAGEFDAFARLKVFGGWEAFRSNLDPFAAGSATTSASDGTRGFGGVRTPIGTRSSVAFRVEQGDRRSRQVVDEQQVFLSDTGVITAEWQAGLGALNGVARYSRRQNVESRSLAGSHTVDDTSGHVFVSLSPATQIFGNATATTTSTREGGGSTFWQVGGGAQMQMLHRSLWLRAEGTAGSNMDKLSALTFPQHSLNVGLNGEIARNTVLGLNINADRLAAPTGDGPSWIARSSVRLTRTFQTGAQRLPTSVVGAMARHGGTGSISGAVFSDWNGNARQDPGEEWLENIPVRLTNLGNAATSAKGEFAFLNVPIGLQEIGIDVSALPVDFDPPAIPHVQIQLGRGETKRVSFGLVPFGAVSGRVVLDANENGVADANERTVDGAVVVLDGGARSEQVKKGQFQFHAVRSGDHTVHLLPESLPDDMSPLDPAERAVSLTRERQNAALVFLVTRHRRPELRRVFEAKTQPAEPAAVRRGTDSSRPTPPRSIPRPPAQATATPTPVGAKPSGPALFAVQVVALNDPSRARETVEALKASALPAYLVEPPLSDPDAPYRVRIGRYATEHEARAAAAVLQKSRRDKLWVVRER
jgi:hypothetical protein